MQCIPGGLSSDLDPSPRFSRDHVGERACFPFNSLLRPRRRPPTQSLGTPRYHTCNYTGQNNGCSDLHTWTTTSLPSVITWPRQGICVVSLKKAVCKESGFGCPSWTLSRELTVCIHHLPCRFARVHGDLEGMIYRADNILDGDDHMFGVSWLTHNFGSLS